MTKPPLPEAPPLGYLLVGIAITVAMFAAIVFVYAVVVTWWERRSERKFWAEIAARRGADPTDGAE